ncbi:hypothetical protein FOMPIDRAFT_86389 [Fomitopsis schrenkii]|uniref:Uncharacterized protein n=1 Tax=Fomitopsis schrenkii TaxID=2126942 RepID=S8DN81_FOMSC|nr:hypothetical protein FOMPIDRAFT_86389 [Fomitopsis schrenkii]
MSGGKPLPQESNEATDVRVNLQTYVSESSHPFDCLKQEAIDYTIRMWKVQGRSRVLPSRLEGPCSPSPGSFTLILGRS